MRTVSHEEPLTTESRPFLPRSIDGWALRRLLSLEGPEHILQFAISASNLRRQCIFIALAALEGDNVAAIADQFRRHRPTEDWRDQPAIDLAHALTKWRANDIVEAMFGGVPCGMVGGLNKIGAAPFRDPAMYRKLHDLLAGHYGRLRAEALLQLRRISEGCINIALGLDPAICRPGVLESVRSIETADAINMTAELARSLADATDDSLRQSVPVDAKGGWNAWANRWIGKAERFPVRPPIPDDDEIVGLHAADQIRDASRRFENCLQSRISGPAIGRCYYLEWIPNPAIIMLESLSGDHWMLVSIHAPKNGFVDDDLKRAIWAKLEPLGVLVRAADAHAQKWNPVATLVDLWEWHETFDLDAPGLRGIK